ncbi:MAG TPA: hypothetical protein VFP94_09290 [Terriglobales bacterium]|nr:hypothetical protein [Terriglobales bacterium]
MAWEIEHAHVDLAEMMHVTTFVERTVKNRNGEPARHLLQIRLGDHLKLDSDGQLLDTEGKPYDVRGKQQEILAALNAQHQAARKFAQRHGAVIGAPKKVGK